MKRLCMLLITLLLILSCSGSLAAMSDEAFDALVKKYEEREKRTYTSEEKKKLRYLIDEADQDRLDKLAREYVPKEKNYFNNTVCAFGPQFREVAPKLTREWYMFTPIDLSQDGTQTFDLIAGHMFVVGEVRVTVKDGRFTVDYEYASRDIEGGREYFTVFKDYESITRQDLDNFVVRYSYGRPYSIEEKFGGDTDVILFVCNTATFDKDARGIYGYYSTNDDREAMREEMLEMIGKAKK